MSRREALVAAALAVRPLQASADPPSAAQRPIMPPSIRPATPQDLPAIVALLIQDAQARRALDPVLWRLAADAPARLGRDVGATLDRPAAPARALWRVAEHADRIVGVAHALMVEVPPIYDAVAGPPGLLLDDCVTSADAPPGTAEALLVATEAALRTAGAAALIASCPAAGAWRPLYERHGYEPVTLYMAKHRLSAGAAAPGAAAAAGVRAASAADVPAIVALSAQHRATLAALNPRFWHIHRDADRRFDAWMRRSLTLPDRDMLVAEAPAAAEAAQVHGYIIAQPCSPLLVPGAHDIAAIGVIDDFYDAGLADVAASSSSASRGAALLAAAEAAFARRAVDSALVVCPAAWSSKIALLEGGGYRTAKLWMLKR
jgi:hypothetical protein